MSERKVRRDLERLERQGYVELIRTPRGQQIHVLNSRRDIKGNQFSKVRARSHTSNAHVTLTNMDGQSDKNGQSEVPTSDRDGHSIGKNGHSNIRVSTLREQLEERALHITPQTAQKTAPLAGVFCSPEKDPPYRQESTPIPSLGAIVKGLPAVTTEAELQARENLLAKQKEQILAQYPRAKAIHERQAIA